MGGVGQGCQHPLQANALHLTAPVEQDDSFVLKESPMTNLTFRVWTDDTAQDIAEYAVMLAVILVLVVGTIRLIGSNANNAFSSVASSIQ
jgi:Flp pilus assembly pilin Flp